MPKPKRSQTSNEKERFEVLLEEIRSQLKLALDGITSLSERMDRLEHRMERLEQNVQLLQSAVLANSTDVQGLRRDMRNLTERFEEHVRLQPI